MKLTKENALDMSIELWEGVVEEKLTMVDEKVDLCRSMFGHIHLGCPLCEYAKPLEGNNISNSRCPGCPYYDEFGFCERGAYGDWRRFHDLTSAKRFLDQLYLIRGKGTAKITGELRPEPKFKVGDEVIGIRSYAKDMEASIISEVFWAEDRPDMCTPSEYWLYRINEINYGEDMIELAPPKEAWVDVTKECDFTILNERDHLAIEHSHMIVGHVRFGQYKIADVWYTSVAFGQYKIEGTPAEVCPSRVKIVVLKKVV